MSSIVFTLIDNHKLAITANCGKNSVLLCFVHTTISSPGMTIKKFSFSKNIFKQKVSREDKISQEYYLILYQTLKDNVVRNFCRQCGELILDLKGKGGNFPVRVH